MSAQTLICVAPISPTYSPTHRYLFYTSLLLSVLYPTPPPLVKGAFAFSLTYSATAALYAMLLLSSTPKPSSTHSTAAPFPATTNLDIAAITAVLSASAITILPLQTWTKSLSRSAHNILRVWGIFITIGVCTAFTLLVRAKPLATFSISSTEVATAASCQAQHSGKLRLRNPRDVDVVAVDRIFGKLYNIIVKHTSALLFLPLLFGVLACLISGRQAQLRPEADDSNQDIRSSVYSFDSGIDASSTKQQSSLKSLFLGVRKAVLIVTPWCWITVVVVNELYLLDAGGLPEVENIGEVGQWGLLAGLGFVAAAAGWNSVVGNQEVKVTGMSDVVV